MWSVPQFIRYNFIRTENLLIILMAQNNSLYLHTLQHELCKMAPVFLLGVSHEGGSGIIQLDNVLAPILADHQLQSAHLQASEDLAYLTYVFRYSYYTIFLYDKNQCKQFTLNYNMYLVDPQIYYHNIQQLFTAREHVQIRVIYLIRMI